MKTNKHQTLLFAKQNGKIDADDLIETFRYSAPTARSYLARLRRQGLLAFNGVSNVVTKKGMERINFFEKDGCGVAGCHHCEHLTCPTCGWQFKRSTVQIQPAKENLLFRRAAGVYCRACGELVLSESAARSIGIS